MRGCFAAFGPVGVAGTTLHEVGREVKSVRGRAAGQGEVAGQGVETAEPRGPGGRAGFQGVVAEAEGFEPSMDGKAQTALAVCSVSSGVI